jgi:hypothetical protein
MDFSKLKKQSSFDKLQKEVEKLNTSGFEKDESEELYWKPTPDKAGNALAVIRFLPGPAVDGDDALPWVKYFDHGFKNPKTGKYYIEKSLTTFGKDSKDPVSEYNSKLWNSTSDDDGPARKQARDQKRRLHYVSLIQVVSDPKNPENEGKIFYYRYGKKIMDKITKMMNPDLDTEPKVNPFDFWKGANFKLKMTRQVANIGGRQVSFPNYDESTFLTPGPLSEDDSVLERIWKESPSLLEIIDKKHFKSYDQLKARLEEVLGHSIDGEARTAAPSKVVVEEDDDTPFEDAKPIAATKKAPPPVADDDDDDDLKQFRDLLNDD